MRRRSLAVAALLLTACDWPWPTDRVDDPLRCDPACGQDRVCRDGQCVYEPCKPETCSGRGQCLVEGETFRCQCEPGFSGPSCADCTPAACNDHGTCTAGTCVCNTGYAGAKCERCAAGYVGYPSCTCECAKTQPRTCEGSAAYKQCTNGCNWSQTACAAECQAASWSLGRCAVSPLNQQADCWCSNSASQAWLDIGIKYTCNDGKTVSFNVFDSDTKKALYQPDRQLSATKPLHLAVVCDPGKLVCYGAWYGTWVFGCGQGCKVTCPKGCCWTCPASGTIELKQLQISC